MLKSGNLPLLSHPSNFDPSHKCFNAGHVLYCPEQAPIPILTVLWFFRVLRVTAHHVKFPRSKSEGRSTGLLSSHSCNCSDALWTTRHQASKVRTHPSVALFAAFFPCSTKFAYCKQRLNTAETYSNEATSRSALQHDAAFSTVGLASTNTDEPTMQVDSVPWQLTSHPGWAFAWGYLSEFFV